MKQEYPKKISGFVMTRNQTLLALAAYVLVFVASWFIFVFLVITNPEIFFGYSCFIEPPPR